MYSKYSVQFKLVSAGFVCLMNKMWLEYVSVVTVAALVAYI